MASVTSGNTAALEAFRGIQRIMATKTAPSPIVNAIPVVRLISLVYFDLRLDILYKFLCRLECWNVVSGDLNRLLGQNISTSFRRPGLHHETSESSQINILSPLEAISHRTHERLDCRLHIVFFHTGFLGNPVDDIRFGHLD